jgi:hypothetical protein
MNGINLLLNQNIPFPVNWFISTPNLYGTYNMWDIIGGRSASLIDIENGSTVWQPFSTKPGSLGGCISTTDSANVGYLNIQSSLRKSCTITCWAKINSITNNGYVIATSVASFRMRSSNQNKVTIDGINFSTMNVEYGEWTHLAITIAFNIGEEHKLYINGKLAITSPASQNVSSCIVRGISNSVNGATVNTQIRGEYDDIMLFDIPLTEETIRGIYKNAFTRKTQMSQFLNKRESFNLSIFSAFMGGQF